MMSLVAAGQDPISGLCGRLSEISEPPLKHEAVKNEIFNAFISAGSKAIPCLTEKLTDRTPMADPRKAPPFGGITVGDTAFFILLEITKLPITDFLPEKVRKSYEEEGVYAYFKYVEVPGNREKSQEKWKAWQAKEEMSSPR